jgi:hypothetical protein
MTQPDGKSWSAREALLRQVTEEYRWGPQNALKCPRCHTKGVVHHYDCIPLESALPDSPVMQALRSDQALLLHRAMDWMLDMLQHAHFQRQIGSILHREGENWAVVTLDGDRYRVTVTPEPGPVE